MKVELLKNCSAGKAGQKIEGADVWRLCFPAKGCVAKPVDSEASAAVERDINTTSGPTRQRLIAAMQNAGSLPQPKEPEPPKPAPKVDPVVEVKPDPVPTPAVEEKPVEAEEKLQKAKKQ